MSGDGADRRQIGAGGTDYKEAGANYAVDKSVYYLDCGDGFMDQTYVKTYQIIN